MDKTASADNDLNVVLTKQQRELLDEIVEDRSYGSIEKLLDHVLQEFFRQEPHHLTRRRFQPAMADLSTRGTRAGSDSFQLGASRYQQRLVPVSGKAVEVRAGEILRISQVEGEQCVDFNAFSLDDFDERMSVGHSRRQGFRLVEGDVVISNRHRPLLQVAHMPSTCVTDLLGARCNGPMFEKKFGFRDRTHTNCQDTLAESIREYGLSSDDVHDSFNMWMNTNWDGSGNWWVEWNSATPNDYVDLLACYDTLCVPVTCGSGDLHPTSNFFLRPIDIEVFEVSASSSAVAEGIRERHAAVHAGVRTGPGESEDRSLRRDESYESSFLRYPLDSSQVLMENLDERVNSGLEALVENGWAQDQGDAARKAIILWYLRNAGKNNVSVGGRFRW